MSFVTASIFFFAAGEVFARLYSLNHRVYDIEMLHYANRLKVEYPDSTVGHFHKPNATAKLMGVTLATNSDGFRDKEYPLSKSQARRLIFLGDSLTLGWGVEEKDTFSTLLENKLNQFSPTEIINFGVGNYNTEQEVHLFLDKGLQYHPDEVVVFYFINDAEEAKPENFKNIFRHSDLAAFYWSAVTRLSNRLRYEAYYHGLYREGDRKGWARTQEAFLLLKQRCVENGIGLRVVLLPELHRLRDYPFKTEHQLVKDFLEKNHVACLDLAPFFYEKELASKLWVAKDDAHPNAVAHRLIAAACEKFVSYD